MKTIKLPYCVAGAAIAISLRDEIKHVQFLAVLAAFTMGLLEQYKMGFCNKNSNLPFLQTYGLPNEKW